MPRVVRFVAPLPTLCAFVLFGRKDVPIVGDMPCEFPKEFVRANPFSYEFFLEWL